MGRPRGRLYQAAYWESDLVQGELVRGVAGTSAVNPEILMLKLDGTFWHRLFLDAQVSCWGEWELDEDSEDLSQLGSLVGRRMGVALSFPSFSGGPAGLHLHLCRGEKLVMSEGTRDDLAGPPILELVPGTVHESYLELFALADGAVDRERPGGLDSARFRAEILRCGRDLEIRLGRPIVLDQVDEGGGFFGDLVFSRVQLAATEFQQRLRFSNFERMVTLTNPDVDQSELSVVRAVVRQHGFIWVPPSSLDFPHAKYGTWRRRYFENF